MGEHIRIGISSCLLGERVRYDGGHKLDHLLRDTLGKYVNWVPVCPEVECGLPVPREAMHLVGDPESSRLVTVRTGIGHTERMLAWAEKRLRELEKDDLCGFVLKSKSPSCGMKGIKVHGPSGMAAYRGVGIFAKTLMARFPLMPVEDDERLNDPMLRENFIERVFVFRRWKEFRKRASVRGLVEFHTDHKLLIMAHSPKHCTFLGRHAAEVKRYRPEELFAEYLRMLMEGLQLTSTVKKNVNVLMHIMGYFKKSLSADEKQELMEVIGDYHRGYLPLVVPVALLKHYVKKYDEPYLKRQYYLNPHPAELMLRNHT